MKVFVAILCLLVFTHCTLDDDVTDYLNFKPSLVVNGDLSPQKGVYLEVSYLLDPENTHIIEDVFITDAKVSVMDASNTFLTVVPYNIDQEAYVSHDLDLHHNQVYQVEVEHGDFPPITCAVHIPSQIDDLQASFEEFDREVDEAHIRLSYDERGDEMFYRMFARGFVGDLVTYPKDYPGQVTPEVSPFFCNMNNPLYYDNSCHSATEQNREVDLWIRRVMIRSDGEYEPAIYIYDSLELTLESITPIYKEYGAYIDEIPEDLDLLFAEQRRTPTNVEGGFGIIAGKSIHSVKVYIP